MTEISNNMTEVTAAVIKKDGKILICRRPANKSCALLWEFPGGKQEPGETLEQALARECLEELNINISVKEKLHETVYEYPGRKLRLHFFAAEIDSGTIMRKEHSEIKWVLPQEMKQHEFCPSDTEFISVHKF